MPVMDEFKEQREALKNGSKKQKWDYFWDYYKFHVICTIVVIIIASSLAYDIITSKEYGFYAIFLNSYDIGGGEEFTNDFAHKSEIDLDKYEVLIDSSLYLTANSYDDTSYTATQKIMVYIASNEIDVIVSDASTIAQYTANETFADLREILSSEQLEKYKPYFYYVDMDFIKQRDTLVDAGEDVTALVAPNPRLPETMIDPIPVAIYMDNSEKIFDSYTFRDGEEVVLGVVVNTLRLDLALQFIDYCFE